MSERVSNNPSESGHVVEYSMAHHDKGEHAVYKVVPQILVGALDDLHLFEGFAIGGSYANGRYKDGDDVDIDVFFDNYPDLAQNQMLLKELKRRFAVDGLTAEVRAPLAKSALPEHLRKSLYEPHPNTPFVVRNIQVANEWGLTVDSNS